MVFSVSVFPLFSDTKVFILSENFCHELVLSSLMQIVPSL